MHNKPFRLFCFFLFLIISIVSDQFTKQIAIETLGNGEHLFFNGILSLKVIHNSGAAFSMLSNGTIFVTLISVIFACFLTSFVIYSNSLNIKKTVLFSLIVGGGVSNIIDRFINPPFSGQGYVIDFINYANLFIGNIADIFIVLGVFIFVLTSLLSGERVNMPMKFWGTAMHVKRVSTDVLTKKHHKRK